MDVVWLDKVKNLLNKKMELLERVYNLTDSFSKEVAKNDAERYIYLIERRQNLFEDMMALDIELEAAGFTDEIKQNTVLQEKLDSIRRMSESVIQLDKSMTQAVDSMMNTIKVDMRTTKKNKVVTNRYVNDAYMGISKFDTRN